MPVPAAGHDPALATLAGELRGANLRTALDGHGATAVHVAVTTGSVAVVRAVLAGGGYVEAEDYRSNTPLYYACTHPGVDGALGGPGDESARVAVVECLLGAGGNGWRQGGFSGKRCFDQAAALGYVRTAQAVRDHPYTVLLGRVRGSVNKAPLPQHVAALVLAFADLRWRGITVGWLCNAARHNTAQCFRPHPRVVEAFTAAREPAHCALLRNTEPSTAARLEAVSRDCAARCEALVGDMRRHVRAQVGTA